MIATAESIHPYHCRCPNCGCTHYGHTDATQIVNFSLGYDTSYFGGNGIYVEDDSEKDNAEFALAVKREISRRALVDSLNRLLQCDDDPRPVVPLRCRSSKLRPMKRTKGRVCSGSSRYMTRVS